MVELLGTDSGSVSGSGRGSGSGGGGGRGGGCGSWAVSGTWAGFKRSTETETSLLLQLILKAFGPRARTLKGPRLRFIPGADIWNHLPGEAERRSVQKLGRRGVGILSPGRTDAEEDHRELVHPCGSGKPSPERPFQVPVETFHQAVFLWMV